jgi:hypothetical protein
MPAEAIFGPMTLTLAFVLTLAQVFGPGTPAPQLPQYVVDNQGFLISKANPAAKPLIQFRCFAPVVSTSCTALHPDLEKPGDRKAAAWILRLANEATVSDRPRGQSCRLEIQADSPGFVAGLMVVIPTDQGDRRLNALWPAMARMEGDSEAAIRQRIERFATSGFW